MAPPTVIAVFGPTAVGKTEVALALAERLRAEGEDPVAVAADAMQVYAGLETLTGAATPAQQAGLEHRLVGFVAGTETFSAGRYAQLAHREIDGLLAAGRRPIVIGGTGLYLRAALADLDLRPAPAPELRRRFVEDLERRGPAALHAELAARAPAHAEAVAPGDRHRIVRSLELLEAGHPLAPAPGGTSSQLWATETRHPTILAGLTMERTALAARIDARVDAMVAAGAVEEVRRADAAGASATARKALGFDELLRGDVDAMKTRTRRYAKRQLTWMVKLPGIVRIDVTGRPASAAAAELHAALARVPA